MSKMSKKLAMLLAAVVLGTGCLFADKPYAYVWINGTTDGVAGTISIYASANSTDGISGVCFCIDGNYCYWDTTSPYSINLDTEDLTDGVHEIEAYAVDKKGDVNVARISINVCNTMPVVKIYYPSYDGCLYDVRLASAAATPLNIYAKATYSVGIEQLDLFVNGQWIWWWGSDTINCNLSFSNFFKNGQNTIKVLAIGLDGKESSTSRIITVNK